MFGWSPIQWLTDNLIGLIPDSMFTGIGELALGDSVKAAAASPEGAAVSVDANDFVLNTNPNDKIGGVLDNTSVQGMLGYLAQIAGLLSERQEIVIGSGTASKIAQVGAATKSFKK